jgi:ABC-2 type transport system ATP-binding protein
MIKAEGLSMQYGPVKALDNVSFEVNKGEVVGLLGPNGAGKSTTMKILTTYLYPSGGKAQVGGYDVLENPVDVRRVIGYLPEVLPVYMDMEVRDYLDFVGKARGLTGARLKERTEIILDACGLRPMYRKLVRELSKGYKQRTALGQALIHDPEVIILDEPTSGLDPHQILEIRELIGVLAKEKTVILSTHILSEIEASADRIVIISQGKIVGNGTTDELRDRAKEYECTSITVEGDRKDVERQLSGVEGVKKVSFTGEANGSVSFELHSGIGTDVWNDLNKLIKAQQWQLRELRDKPLSLEETFLSLTEKVGQKAEK